MPKKKRDEDRPKKDLIRELEELRQQVAGLKVEKTGRKQVEEALKVSENRATSLLDAIPHLMFRLDRVRGFHQQCERGLFRILRRRSNKARKMTWKDFHRIAKGRIPKPRVAHPFPDKRFRRQRLEVGAV